MAHPGKYTRQFNYSDATLPDLRSNLNPELDALQALYDDLVEAMKDVRRSDGALPNEKVRLVTLHPEVLQTLEDKEQAAKDARDDAIAARNAAQTAQTGAETAQSQAETARTGAENARDVAEAERVAAQIARTEAQTARTQSQNARDQSQAAASQSSASASAAFKSKVEAQAAAVTATNVILFQPDTDATVVYVDERDFGDLETGMGAFSNESDLTTRVDLARGTAQIDLGGLQ